MPQLTDFIDNYEERPRFLAGRATYKAERLDAAWKETEGAESGERVPAPYETANLVGSKTIAAESYENAVQWHEPVIDLDFPAHLEPSSTEGHFHLYLNRSVEWEPFLKVLEAMKDAGLVEEGFYEMTKRRGQAFVRRPGVRKTEAERYVRYVEDDDTWDDRDDPFGDMTL